MNDGAVRGVLDGEDGVVDGGGLHGGEDVEEGAVREESSGLSELLDCGLWMMVLVLLACGFGNVGESYSLRGVGGGG